MFQRSWRFLAVAPIWVALAGHHAPQSPLIAADKHYREQSYGAALKEYESALHSGMVPPSRRDEVEYRIVVSLDKTQKWDRALSEGIAFVKRHRGTVWEPRGLYWLGRLYTHIPSQGYRVGKKFYRGSNVPKSIGGLAVESVSVESQDAANALDALEAAKVMFPNFRTTNQTEADEVQLNYDLIRVLENNERGSNWRNQAEKWVIPGATPWQETPLPTYALDWPLPTKQLYLYHEIQSLASNRHARLVGMLAKAVFVKNYQSSTKASANKYINGKWMPIPFPYQDLKPEVMLRHLVEVASNDPLRDQAQILLAAWFTKSNRFTEAIAECEALIHTSPKGAWAEDARQMIERVRRPRLVLSSSEDPRIKSPSVLNLDSRNLKSVNFKIHRIDLVSMVKAQATKRTGESSLTDLAESFKNLKSLARFRKDQVAVWVQPLKDKGDHKFHREVVKLPISAPGAYLVEASYGSVRSGTIVVLGNLTLIQKSHASGVLFFAADSRSGKPVAGAQILLKRFWREKDKNRVLIDSCITGKDGLIGVPWRRRVNQSDDFIAAMARFGESYALTNPEGWYGYQSAREPMVAYLITDRSVYRPQQKVHYREVVYKRLSTGLLPAVKQPVRIKVTNSNGDVVHDRRAKSNEFGSVNGEFDLPAGARLGEYSVNCTVGALIHETAVTGNTQFRVEEYKKPEFEVTVTPSADRVRLGETITAKVKATYYFGGPVPGAKVTYRIHASPFSQTYQFPRAFDFLWKSWNEGEYDSSFRRSPVIKQGEARTDNNGEATVTFDTPKPKETTGVEAEAQTDYSFNIEADVQDASRRVISGSGTTRATRNDVAVFLNYPHGYALQGDRVDVEIMTRTPSDLPVSVKGIAKVLRPKEDPKAKPDLIYDEPLTTDSQGRAYLRWKANTSGYFRVVFETRDRAEQKVEGSIDLCVEGRDLSHGKVHRPGLFMAIKNPYYEEGQTARVLLVAPKAGCTALVTREADGVILQKEIVRIEGFSRELQIPLRHADVPNVHLSAVIVRDGELLSANEELFVPPARQFSTVTVKADKERYQPGEKARLSLSVRDWLGRPLRTELSVTVSDASLNYIQKGYAPDIRAFLFGDRRAASTSLSGSVNVGFDVLNEDDKPWTQRNHVWMMPEGLGMLETSIYDYSGRGRRVQPGQIGNGLRLDPSEGQSISASMSPMSLTDQINLASRRETEAKTVSHFSALTVRGAAGPEGANIDMGRSDGYFRQVNSRGTIRIPGFPSDTFSGKGGERLPTPNLRKRFADTAFWTPAVIADSRGNATVEVVWPDNLTRWSAKAIGTSTTAQVGVAETTVTTRKNLLVRLQTPRFLVERDKVVLTANIQNYLPQDARVKVSLELEGSAATDSPTEQWVEVPKEGEKRIDWTATVNRSGLLRVRMTAQTESAADATETIVPMLVHGAERVVVETGELRQKSTKLSIELPHERAPGSASLVVQLNPSLATVMLDALPYLADYPYGCIEQTMSRFLPSVVVEKTLKDLGYDLADLRQRAVRQKGAAADNPVFSTTRLKSMVKSGLARISEMQHNDGGWGWWQTDSSDVYMTSYVLYGLLLAKDAGINVNEKVLSKGLDFLKKHISEQVDANQLAYQVRVFAMDTRYRPTARSIAETRLFPRRDKLSEYGKALLAIALAQTGDKAKAAVVLRNIENTASVDDANGTASWENSDRYSWRWYNDRVETNATILQAYQAVNPGAKLSPMVMKWLVNNRHGNTWKSTRETAIAVMALADYSRIHKELASDYTVTVDIDGKLKRSFAINKKTALLSDNRFVVRDADLHAGIQTLNISRTGTGPLYWTATTQYFSLEEPIPAAGGELKVTRRYFRLIPGTATGTPEPVSVPESRPNPFLTGRYELLEDYGFVVETPDTNTGPNYQRTEIEDEAVLTSGDLIEVELEVESKNEYDYVLIEDPKPAGCEPVELRSGRKEGKGIWSNMELRDQKVAFFISSLPQGRRTLVYRLRAETPGTFHVMPTKGQLMYAPDVRALSEERRLGVKDEN